MRTALRPQIEIFNPFVTPFTTENSESKTKQECFTIVKPEVKCYMRSSLKGLEIVAKCTPCQCCACR